MNDRQSSDDRLVRYLLGEALPDAEQAEIEERYFTDELYFDHVLALEDDLIDSYVRGGLSETERTRFEKHFLVSDRRRQKWEAQQAIASFLRSRSEPVDLVSGPILSWGSLTFGARLLLGISFVLAVGIGMLGWRYMQMRNESNALRSRLVTLREQSAPPVGVATFVLKPERLRSGRGAQLQIAKDTRWVILKIELPQFAAAYSMFAAGLSTADGRAIWEQNGLPRVASTVEINLPASALEPGDFVLSLSAVEGERQIKLPAYQFRIDR